MSPRLVMLARMSAPPSTMSIQTLMRPSTALWPGPPGRKLAADVLSAAMVTSHSTLSPSSSCPSLLAAKGTVRVVCPAAKVKVRGSGGKSSGSAQLFAVPAQAPLRPIGVTVMDTGLSAGRVRRKRAWWLRPSITATRVGGSR